MSKVFGGIGDLDSIFLNGRKRFFNNAFEEFRASADSCSFCYCYLFLYLEV